MRHYKEITLKNYTRNAMKCLHTVDDCYVVAVYDHYIDFQDINIFASYNDNQYTACIDIITGKLTIYKNDLRLKNPIYTCEVVSLKPAVDLACKYIMADIAHYVKSEIEQ